MSIDNLNNIRISKLIQDQIPLKYCTYLTVYTGNKILGFVSQKISIRKIIEDQFVPKNITKFGN